MPDMEYIEQNAYNQGYRRGYEAGRKKAREQFDEVLTEKLKEVRAVLRTVGAEIAIIVREAMNDGDEKERDGDETD